MRNICKLARIAVVVTLAGLGTVPVEAAMDMSHAAPPTCAALTLACAATATPFVAPDGALWIVARVGNALFVTRSGDDAKTFSSPVALDIGAVTLDWGPDARPKIVVDRAGNIVVAYAIFRDTAFNGEVFVTRSIDGGRTFAKPRPITEVQESQRFPSLGFDRDGHLFAVWIDKRGRRAAKANGVAYEGAGLAVSISADGGAGFGQAMIAREGTCECCRTALAFTPAGKPVAMFRNIFAGGVRDHAVIAFDGVTPGPLHRVSVDDWATNVCPHHGPSLAVAADGSYHATWFTLGKARQGLFYARSTDEGAHFSPPMKLGLPGQALSRPYVLASGTTIRLAWKSFDGEKTNIMLMTSHDDGRSWGAPLTIAASAQPSDHPILIEKAGDVFLSWQTQDGYRLMALKDAS